MKIFKSSKFEALKTYTDDVKKIKDREKLKWSSTVADLSKSEQKESHNIWWTFYLPTVILSLILTAFLVAKFTTNWQEAFILEQYALHSDKQCNIQLVESIPEGLVYAPNSQRFMSTYDAWKILINSKKDSLHIGSFYWTLLGSDVIEHPSAAEGEEIYKLLLENAMNGKPKIDLRIAQSMPSENVDTDNLARQGAAKVRTVDFLRLLKGGVLHTKLWIVDNKHFYVGSANMDWRSLTQVKELGVLGINCPSIGMDLSKIFQIYWDLGKNDSKIPDKWPDNLATEINMQNPLLINYNNNKYNMLTYIASSPPPLSAGGRTQDLEAIINTINTAKYFVNVAVMDYYPLQIYTHPIKYWPYIDDALRTAAVERGVAIKLLISKWKHSHPSEDYFLRSLISLSEVMPNVNIQIKRFVVPSDENQSQIPFARVNHNKYMVTDNTAYIGTSNWSGDYFIDTAGIGLVLRDISTKAKASLRNDLLSVFVRDWDSIYAYPL